jgi:hypothetical protein
MAIEEMINGALSLSFETLRLGVYACLAIYCAERILIGANNYVSRKSEQFSSVEEMEEILEEEKKRLGLDDFEIIIRDHSSQENVDSDFIPGTYCLQTGDRKYVLFMGENSRNRGMLRHELKHVNQITYNNPLINWLNYLFVNEPSAIIYSLTALKREV